MPKLKYKVQSAKRKTYYLPLYLLNYKFNITNIITLITTNMQLRLM